ncbi:hypothetical protein NP233_g5686 [Leucocoprinus birnbaumii]|uniref:SH3 domain-containing protein n=1 Tax=Leucocoprinus birnbaumii TaxID=56174 RepID=A0AAD5VYI6_9AGAR|nr:hypothetical protein NP233_g5686 [Leucocoprinus birnbaumii]
MPIIALSRRAAEGALQNGSGSISAMYIIGFSIAGAIFLAIVLWLGVYLYRRRRARQRQSRMGAAFLSVRGLVKEDSFDEKYSPSQPNSPMNFNRSNMGSKVVLPTKALIKTSQEQLRAERDYIVAHHQTSNSTPKPFSFALQTSPSPRPTSSNERLSVARDSYSPASRMSRFSVFSTNSSYNESVISGTSGDAAGRSIRKIRQTFSPVLPDELLVSPGEQLMVLQSFDDGWCVVGRESGILMPQPKSLFGGSRASRAFTPTLLFGHGGAGVGTRSGGNVELGMVPAWCFLKPVKGLRAERPMRSSSLGVTVQMDGLGVVDRNDTISWSNF